MIGFSASDGASFCERVSESVGEWVDQSAGARFLPHSLTHLPAHVASKPWRTETAPAGCYCSRFGFAS
jgi:hypothetical protein